MTETYIKGTAVVLLCPQLRSVCIRKCTGGITRAQSNLTFTRLNVVQKGSILMFIIPKVCPFGGRWIKHGKWCLKYKNRLKQRFPKGNADVFGCACVCVFILCSALSLPNKGIFLLRLFLFNMYCNNDSAWDKIESRIFKKWMNCHSSCSVFPKAAKAALKALGDWKCSLQTHYKQISNLNAYVSRVWLSPPLGLSKYFQ